MENWLGRHHCSPDRDPSMVVNGAWMTDEGSSAHELLKGIRAGLAFQKLGYSYDLMCQAHKFYTNWGQEGGTEIKFCR